MRDAVVPRTEAGVEHLTFATRTVLAGEFRCAPEHWDFRGAGRIHNFVVAFPRSAVWIHREHERPFVADPAIATIYNPGEAYQRAEISPEGDHSDYFAVAEPIARDIVERLDTHAADRARVFTHARAPVSSQLYHAQRRVAERLRRSECDTLEAEERVMRIVAEVLRSAYSESGRASQRRRRRKRSRDLLEGAKELLMSSMYENLSVTELAARLHVSPFHLCRTFRSATGASLHEYRRSIRLRVALGRVASSRGNLSALALELGFSSHAHFTTAYHKCFGRAPSGSFA